MFNQPVDDRLSSWVQFRNELEASDDPLSEVWEFWKHAPFVPYNPKIDPYYPHGWPTPWEIIVDNKYDDFTRSLMIGWTLKLTRKFENSHIDLKTLVDKQSTRQYNIVCVDDSWIINHNDTGPESLDKLPSSFRLENLIELSRPR